MNSSKLVRQGLSVVSSGALVLTAVGLTVVTGVLPAAAAPTTCTPTAGFNACFTFPFTGSDQPWPVPDDVHSLNVELKGAGGGAFNGTAGGLTSGTVAVTPGQSLTVMVGGTGATPGPATYGGGGASGNGSRFSGGAGGGMSALWDGPSGGTPLLIAGGGGGGAEGGVGGGAGGGVTGANGQLAVSGRGSAAGGGRQSEGGAAAVNPSPNVCTLQPTPGQQFKGGDGGNGSSPVATDGGGGGGGGYFGGGGGACQGQTTGDNSDSGGGGGSGFTGGAGVTGATTTTGGGSALKTNGTVTIQYQAPKLAIVKTQPEGPVTPGGELTYTVTAQNTGMTNDTNANFTDDLTDVLDDATWVSSSADIGTATFTSPTLKWSIPVLAPGQRATITYVVKVGKPPMGNKKLANAASSTNVSTNCPAGAATDPQCTGGGLDGTAGGGGQPLAIGPSLSVKKERLTGQIVPGGKVEYQVTVTNDGGSDFTDASPATFSDDLSDVLDDAAYHGDAAATAGTATFDSSAMTLSWEGPLKAQNGATPAEAATITYSVTVGNPPSGNKKLVNKVSSPFGNCSETPVDPAEAATCGSGETDGDVVFPLPVTGQGSPLPMVAAGMLLTLTGAGVLWLTRRRPDLLA